MRTSTASLNFGLSHSPLPTLETHGIHAVKQFISLSTHSNICLTLAIKILSYQQSVYLIFFTSILIFQNLSIYPIINISLPGVEGKRRRQTEKPHSESSSPSQCATREGCGPRRAVLAEHSAVCRFFFLSLLLMCANPRVRIMVEVIDRQIFLASCNNDELKIRESKIMI